eukprot:5820585-Prymnesium_polylepis.1
MLSPPAATSPRTPRSTPRKENSQINVPVAPWSRSKGDRFAGPGSLYKTDAAKQTTPRKTPSKTSLPSASERYATLAERAVNAPANPATPSATYASATDRFTLPGGMHEAKSTPGVGQYDADAKGMERRVIGAVKLQKAIRRRQSRGIFAQIELNAREVPSPGKYESLAESTAGHAAFSKGERGTRFDGPQSFYACEKTPAAGEYDPESAPSAVAGGGAKAAFRGHAERFGGQVRRPHTLPD